jgi:hypothetical protein
MPALLGLLAMCSTLCAQPAWPPTRFPVGYWCGPPADQNTLENWQRVADANFTVGGMASYSPEGNRRMLDFCQKVGLQALILDSRINPRTSIATRWKETLAQVVADYGSHPALLGYFITDEPAYPAFRGLGEVSQELQRLDPAHLPYINLLPTYATPEQLGTPTYEEHLAQFLAITKPAVLSYDHYCLQAGDTEGQQYFENLGLIRDYALRAGIPPWNIIQAMSYARSMRQPNDAEMRWQVYTSLAYGMKGLLYFIYWSYNEDPLDVGIVDHLGQPGPLFPIVQQLNGEIKALGPTLLGLTSTGVFHTGDVPPGATRLGSAQLLSLPAEAPLLVGFFRDAQDVPYAMIVNRSFREPVDFPVTFPSVVGAVSAVSATDGSLSPLPYTPGEPLPLSLAPGDGILLRLGIEFRMPEPPAVLREIRFEFADLAEFKDWAPVNSLDDPQVADSTLSLRVTGSDPFLAREWLSVPPDTYAAVRVRMKLPPGIAEGQFFWTTADDPWFTDTKYLNFPVQGDGQWHEYSIPVGTHAQWRGQTICGIRLDPAAGGTQPGDRVEIDWIRGQ